MRERVPGTVHSLAFALDGRRLLCAHRTAIAIRAWPSLELLALHALPTTLLAATVNGTFLCANDGRVRELDASFVEQRAIDVVGVVAFGVDDHGAIVVARRDIERGSSAFVVERHDATVTVVMRPRLARGQPWWSALLPTRKALIVAMDDQPPEHFDFATGAQSARWEWLPGWSERAHAAGGPRRSWLSVDAAPDERCLVASDKGQGTTIIWLDDVGRVQSYVCLEKRPALGHFGQKGPSRGAAATVHPHDDVAATIDISGRLHVSDARTGKLLDLIDDTFDGGYRWEGRRG